MTTSLPRLLNEIAEVAGVAAALAFAERCGGTRVFIPASVRDGHWLVDCVGRDAADAICRHFAMDGRGQRVDIPLGLCGTYRQVQRTIAEGVHKLTQDGASARSIARRVGVTQRTVHAQRATHRGRKNDKRDRQGSLF